MKDLYIEMDDFAQGFRELEHGSKAPFGSASQMMNVTVSDELGLTPRPGVRNYTNFDTGTDPVNGISFFNRDGNNEIVAFATGDSIYIVPEEGADRVAIKTGLTPNKEFGFFPMLVSKQKRSFLVMGNRYDDYMTWNGVFGKITAAASTGATSLNVDNVSTTDVFKSGTIAVSPAPTTTTVDFTGTILAPSEFVNFFIRFSSGAQSGEIRKITANTSSQITFEALSSAPSAGDTFDIIQLLLEETGKIIVGGNEYEYTAIQNESVINLSTPLSTDLAVDTYFAQAVVSYPAAPRGNRFTNYIGRVVVGNVRSSLAKDESNNIEGTSARGSVFLSKILDPTDFSYSVPLLADEGDVINVAYGDGNVTDVVSREDGFDIYKEDYIESVKYNPDPEILYPSRDPLKQGVGSVGKVIKGKDDVFFMTKDKQFTSLGRVVSKDIKPETTNIGTPIKTFLEACTHENISGVERSGRIYFTVSSNESDSKKNDNIVIFNRNTNTFEGVWRLSAHEIITDSNDLVIADNESPNIYKFDEKLTYDIINDNDYSINTSWRTHFFNVTPKYSTQQSINSMFFQGKISPGCEIRFYLYKDSDYSNPAFSFTFSGDEDDFINNNNLTDFLGGTTLGITAQGNLTRDPNADNKYDFYFRVFFPWQHSNQLAVGFESDVRYNGYSIQRIGLGVREDIHKSPRSVKQI